MMHDVIERTAQYVQEQMTGETTGHDWWHVYRVWKTAQRIGRATGADMNVVELAALLHDIDDYKFNGGDHDAGARKARSWLASLGVDEETIAAVCDIIILTSFTKQREPLPTIEGQIVQDADRLDALGAVGIARAFATGQHMGQQIYDPDDREHSSIGHFYDKLLLLKDRMNTEEGKRIAQERHAVLEQFLSDFYKQWEGE
jgi:uncharacterized protein